MQLGETCALLLALAVAVANGQWCDSNPCLNSTICDGYVDTNCTNATNQVFRGYCYASRFCSGYSQVNGDLTIMLDGAPPSLIRRFDSVIKRSVMDAYNSYCNTSDNYKRCCPGAIAWPNQNTEAAVKKAMESADVEVLIPAARGGLATTTIVIRLAPSSSSAMCTGVSYPSTATTQLATSSTVGLGSNTSSTAASSTAASSTAPSSTAASPLVSSNSPTSASASASSTLAPSGGSAASSSSAPSGGSAASSSSAPSGASAASSSSAPSGASAASSSSAPSGGSAASSTSSPSGDLVASSTSAPSGNSAASNTAPPTSNPPSASSMIPSTPPTSGSSAASDTAPTFNSSPISATSGSPAASDSPSPSSPVPTTSAGASGGRRKRHLLSILTSDQNSVDEDALQSRVKRATSVSIPLPADTINIIATSVNLNTVIQTVLSSNNVTVTVTVTTYGTTASSSAGSTAHGDLSLTVIVAIAMGAFFLGLSGRSSC